MLFRSENPVNRSHSISLVYVYNFPKSVSYTHLPFTTKYDLRDNYPFGLCAVPMSQIVRIHASSGTTGKPTVVGYTLSLIHICSGYWHRFSRIRMKSLHLVSGYGARRCSFFYAYTLGFLKKNGIFVNLNTDVYKRQVFYSS